MDCEVTGGEKAHYLVNYCELLRGDENGDAHIRTRAVTKNWDVADCVGGLT
jgi:hypothetical protein